MSAKTVRAGHYYAAKYHGENGDLILGKVKSVRSNGEVVCANLLSGDVSTKAVDVLASRNHRISKAQADELLALWEETGDRKQVRDSAVNMSIKQMELPVHVPTVDPMKVVKLLAKADNDRRQDAARALIKKFEAELLAIFNRD